MTTISTPPRLDQSSPDTVAPAQPDRRKKPPIDPLGACVVLLHQIWKSINALRRGNEFFQLTVIVNSQASTTGFGSPSRQGGTGASGVIKFIHNPTAAPITLTLLDGDNRQGIPNFNATLQVGESRPVWIPFTTDVMASSGSGCQISGYYRP